MTTKTTNLVYWISTILFAALMVFSSIGGLKPNEQTIQIMHTYLGYPIYFIRFISFAKLASVAAILIPGLNRTVKEWAYAGLFFDLSGALFSGFAAAGKFGPMILTMLAWVLPGVVSYYFWHKKLQQSGSFSR